MHRIGLARVGVIVAALALAACSEAEGPPPHLAIPGAEPDRGRALIVAYGCGACHYVQGVAGADGIVAPRLENFASRKLIVGTLPNVPTNLVAWLRDPPGLEPDTGMPDLGLSDAEARDIASYLYTLGRADMPPRAQAATTDVSGDDFKALRTEQKQRLQGIEQAMDALATDSVSD